MAPYEYHNDRLGVMSNHIFYGRDAADNTLGLISDSGLRKRIEKGRVERLREPGPNTPALVSWLSLPPDWQRRLVETFGQPPRQVQLTRFERAYRRDTKAYDWYLLYKDKNGIGLSDEDVEKYTVNASTLNTLERVFKSSRDFIKAMKGTPNALTNPLTSEKTDAWTIVAQECTKFRDFQSTPHTLPDNPRVLRRRLNKFKKEGYGSLIHKNRANAFARKADEKTIELLNWMFASQSQKPNPVDISRQYDGFLSGYVDVINNETGEMYDPRDYRKLSKSTITNYLRQWENQSATYAKRSGDRQQLMKQFKPYHTLQHPSLAGSIISIDDRQPPFEYGPSKRVWFYNGIDLGSEAITTWVWGKTKEGIIIDFYRQMVRNYTEWGLNIPAELEAESSLNSSFKETFLKEGNMFQFVRIEANNARGKRIEAYFRPLRYGLEKEREGWIARPFARSEANQAGSNKVPQLPYNTIVRNALEDIQTWNNTEHSRYKGKSRWDVFMEMQNENLRPTNWRGILPHLGYKTETSCHTGIIKLQNQEFLLGLNGDIAYSTELINLMKQVEGRDLDVYWLDGNDGQVMKAIVYLRGDNRFICEAIAKPVYNRATIEQTDDDRQARTAMSKYVSSIEAFIKERKRSLERVTVNDFRPRTLNNHFRMPGLDVVEERTQPAEVLPEPSEEEFYNDVSTSFKKALKDRF